MDITIKDIENDLINNNDILVTLRKAHIFASYLDLSDFDSWITNELNGYDDSCFIPEYRKQYAEIYGLIGNNKKHITVNNYILEDDKGSYIKQSLPTIINVHKQGRNLETDVTSEFIKVFSQKKKHFI